VTAWDYDVPETEPLYIHVDRTEFLQIVARFGAVLPFLMWNLVSAYDGRAYVDLNFLNECTMGLSFYGRQVTNAEFAALAQSYPTIPYERMEGEISLTIEQFNAILTEHGITPFVPRSTEWMRWVRHIVDGIQYAFVTKQNINEVVMTHRPEEPLTDEALDAIFANYSPVAAEPIVLDVASAREISLTREELDEVLRFNGGRGVDDALWGLVAEKKFHYASLKEIIVANGGEFYGVDWGMVWSKYGPNSLQKISVSREQLDEIIRSQGGEGLNDNHPYKDILTKDCLNMILAVNHCREASSLEWAALFSKYSVQAS